jgi:hypothetical protein
MPAYTNARQTIPYVFEAIIANDAARLALRDRAADGLMTQSDWRELGELVADRKNLRRGAEQAMRWNTDKGATG